MMTALQRSATLGDRKGYYEQGFFFLTIAYCIWLAWCTSGGQSINGVKEDEVAEVDKEVKDVNEEVEEVHLPRAVLAIRLTATVDFGI